MHNSDSEKKLKNFPNPFADAATKASDEYGIQYAKAIWDAYYNLNVGENSQRNRFIINRKYAEGLESVDKYKSRYGLDGDTSFLNLDFTPTNRIATIVDNIVGKMMNLSFQVQCNPIDPESKTIEDEERNKVYANMFLKQMSDELLPRTGIPLVPPNAVIPESDEEAELYFKMNFKQASSIAMEQAIEYVMMNNGMTDETRRKVLRDLIVLKRACIRRYYDADFNIRIDYEDPIDVITPYSKYDTFKNIPYVGVLRQYTIQEIAQMTTKFSEEELLEIAQKNAGKNNNALWNNNWNNSYEGYYANNNGIVSRPYDNFNIQVLDFSFLCTDKLKRTMQPRKQGGKFWRRLPDNYKAKAGEDVIAKNIQHRYDGCWILDTDHIFNYKKAENMERERDGKNYSPKTTLPIAIIAPNIYDMQNKSHVERMIPHEDQINLISLKFQQLIVKAKPPGVAWDMEAFENISMGMGQGSMSLIEINKMFEQTGNLVYRSKDKNGHSIQTSPLNPLDNGIGRDFHQLISAYNLELQKINDVIGYNDAVDASSPNADSLVGVQKMAIQATNNSLRPLYMAHIQLFEITLKGVSLMIQDSIQYNNEGFIRAIGRHATKTIEYGKKLALHQFGIKIELLPDEEEKMYLEGLITTALSKGAIMTSDAIRVRQVMKQDVKLAEQLLILLEGKNQKNRMAESAALQQQNTQSQIESANAAAQATIMQEAELTKMKAELIKLESAEKIKFEQEVHPLRMQEIMAQNRGKVEVAEVTAEGKLNEKAYDAAIAPKEEVSPTV